MPGKHSFNYYKENKYVPKHITVDLGGQSAAKAGANLSSRQVIDVVDEKGEKIRGFFTENEFINMNQLFASRMNGIKPADGYEQLDVLRQKVLEHPDGIKYFVQAVNHYTKLNFSSIDEPGMQAKYEGQLGTLKKVFTKIYGVPEDTLKDLETDKNVSEYVKGLIKTGFNAYGLTATHTGHQKQTADTNINRRNTAMSDYAELLGLPELTAKSTSMTIKSGDKEMHGSFMVNAEGIPLEQLSPQTDGFAGKVLTVAPSALKQLSNLQILDYLCANVDRHAGNMFYTVDTSDPLEVKITGVQGIDNDASFGAFDEQAMKKQYAYDRMSFIKDINYIDIKTAEKIMSLKPEDVEKKIRLAGLSKEEINAAGERLTLLQDKIRKGDIYVLRDDAEWTRAANDRRLKKEMPYKSATASNIYSIAEGVVNYYNYKVRKGEKQPFAGGQGPKGSVPTAKAISVQDDYSLRDHMEYFENVSETLKKELNGQTPGEAYEPVAEQLNSVLDLMKEYNAKLTSPDSKSRTLSDLQRNILSEELKELAETASEYAEKNPDPLGVDPILHAAKNIMSYAGFAREAVRNDSAEALMNEAAKAADEIRKANNIQDTFVPTLHEHTQVAPTAHTFESLSGRIKGISGRSSEDFKNMIKAFNAIGDISTGKNAIEKQVRCDKLATAAEKYITHKKPEGKTVQLNKKEEARVKFAEDLISYAKANKVQVIEKEKERADKSQEKSDYFSLTAFHSKCDSLVQNYRNAGNEQEKTAAAKNILAEKESFKRGFERILNISGRYIPRHEMQAVCAAMFTGGVAEYMNVYLECSNAAENKKETNVYTALGLNEKDCEKVKDIVKTGTDVREDYKAKNIAEQPQSAEADKEKVIQTDAAEYPGLE